MYWPEIGRFVSADPAGIHPESPQSWNRYAYVLNNPYKYVDPTGRDTEVVFTVKPGGGIIKTDHVAVHVDDGGDGQPVLFDPSGSYHLPSERTRAEHGEADAFVGADADVGAYAQYWRTHKSDQSDIEIYRFGTTKEQEAQIAAGFGYVAGSSESAGDSHSGPVCADSSSTALRNSSAFKNLSWSLFPGSLKDDLARRSPKSVTYLRHLGSDKKQPKEQ